MPYYIGKKSDGTIESLNYTLSPAKAAARYSVFEQIATPVTNYIYDETDGFRPMTEAEIAAAATAAETTRQAAKSDKLKAAENAYLTLLAGLTVSITAEDNSDTIIAKLTESGMDKVDAVETGLKLLNAVHEIELQGGSWYDLPGELHNL